MTSDDFRALLSSKSDAELLQPCLRDGATPYVFEPAPSSWADFRSNLAVGLSTKPDNIVVVGSGRFGFSLRPARNLSPFTDRSDIDVVVVDSDRFDQLWHDLLRAAYPRPPQLQKIGGWLKDRRNEVYTGWLTPLAINLDPRILGAGVKPVLEFRRTWFNAFKGAARIVPRRHEDLTGRLYRTWEHAELYHVDSIRALRRSLAA